MRANSVATVPHPLLFHRKLLNLMNVPSIRGAFLMMGFSAPSRDGLWAMGDINGGIAHSLSVSTVRLSVSSAVADRVAIMSGRDVHNRSTVLLCRVLSVLCAFPIPPPLLLASTNAGCVKGAFSVATTAGI